MLLGICCGKACVQSFQVFSHPELIQRILFVAQQTIGVARRPIPISPFLELPRFRPIRFRNRIISSLRNELIALAVC
jgi:hypothetical protein